MYDIIRHCDIIIDMIHDCIRMDEWMLVWSKQRTLKLRTWILTSSSSGSRGLSSGSRDLSSSNRGPRCCCSSGCCCWCCCSQATRHLAALGSSSRLLAVTGELNHHVGGGSERELLLFTANTKIEIVLRIWWIKVDKSYTSSSSSVEMTRVSPLLQSFLFLMLIFLQENFISAQVSSIR